MHAGHGVHPRNRRRHAAALLVRAYNQPFSVHSQRTNVLQNYPLRRTFRHVCCARRPPAAMAAAARNIAALYLGLTFFFVLFHLNLSH